MCCRAGVQPQNVHAILTETTCSPHWSDTQSTLKCVTSKNQLIYRRHVPKIAYMIRFWYMTTRFPSILRHRKKYRTAAGEVRQASCSKRLRKLRLRAPLTAKVHRTICKPFAIPFCATVCKFTNLLFQLIRSLLEFTKMLVNRLVK